ncbi:MAG: glycosyltransferase [Shewanella fodinae]|nr:glycosyltransferase [Shewanella fodinae]
MAVEAISMTRDLRLNIVGGGPLSSNELKLLESKLPNRYTVLGNLSDEELNYQYNVSYALIYPSSYEGFGIPVVEAMKAGCPVIACRLSSIPEVAGNAALLVDSPSATLLYDAICLVPSKRQNLIQTGFAQASKFSWERTFSQMNTIYNELELGV